MTDKERAQVISAALPEPGYPLDGCVSVFISLAGGLVVGMLLTSLIFAVLNWTHRLSGVVPETLVLSGAVAGFLVGLRSVFRERREWLERRSGSRTACRQDLADGYVNVMRCTVSGVVELLDVEEAPGYFLDVGDGQVLFLNGQYLSQYSEETEDNEPTFPCTIFNMVQSPHSKLTLDVEYLGESLTLTRTLDPEEEDFSGLYFPQDGEVLTASLPTLIDDLRRLNVTRKGDER